MGGLDTIGEGALINENYIRTATVKVTRDSTQVLVLTRKSYNKLQDSGMISKQNTEIARRISFKTTTEADQLRSKPQQKNLRLLPPLPPLSQNQSSELLNEAKVESKVVKEDVQKVK